jgi:hypothetical protein
MGRSAEEFGKLMKGNGRNVTGQVFFSEMRFAGARQWDLEIRWTVLWLIGLSHEP